jgi:hypothetical protein
MATLASFYARSEPTFVSLHGDRPGYVIAETYESVTPTSDRPTMPNSVILAPRTPPIGIGIIQRNGTRCEVAMIDGTYLVVSTPEPRRHIYYANRPTDATHDAEDQREVKALPVGRFTVLGALSVLLAELTRPADQPTA